MKESGMIDDEPETDDDREHYADVVASDEHYGPEGPTEDEPDDEQLDVLVAARIAEQAADGMEWDGLVAELRWTFGRLAGIAPPDDADVLSERFVSLLAIADEIAVLKRDAEARLADLTSGRDLILINGKPWRRNVSVSRTGWDNDGLRSAVARVVIADEDGVVRSGPDVWAMIVEAFSLNGSALRLKWAKANGIDYDVDFVGQKSTSVTLRPVQ